MCLCRSSLPLQMVEPMQRLVTRIEELTEYAQQVGTTIHQFHQDLL